MAYKQIQMAYRVALLCRNLKLKMEIKYVRIYEQLFMVVIASYISVFRFRSLWGINQQVKHYEDNL